MQREITALWGEKKVVLRQTPRAVTPFGGLSVFIAFLQKIGYRQQVSEHLPVHLKSPNAINSGGDLHGVFDLGGGGGATVCAHGACCGRIRPCTPCWGSSAFPPTTRFGTCSSVSGKVWWCSSTSRCGRGNWRGCRSVRAVTVWTWTRRCSSATGNRRE